MPTARVYPVNTSQMIEKARLHAQKSKHRLTTSYPHAIRKLDSLQLRLKDLRRHSAKLISGAALATGLVLGTPTIAQYIDAYRQQQHAISPQDIAGHLHTQLSSILPKHVGPLTPAQEQAITLLINQTLHLRAVASLDGNHLNTTYGRIGGEQHLPRYLGDTIADHDHLQVKGITAGRGAFGYFAPSKDQMTEEAFLREKYYVAVQTLYLPNWNTEYKTLKDWYKFRRVLLINPTNGKSIIAVIGDAGPAAWTGKQFGGSPEVMEYLEPYKNKNNGNVLLFFLDDRENPIALGPVTGTQPVYLAQK